MTSYSLVFFSLSQISGAGRRSLGVGRQEIIFIYSPHFPTPYTPHPTPHTPHPKTSLPISDEEPL
ncbi:MAG: hypothetical protein GPJ07_11595 [Microcystis aeruginosa G13-07]|nr:hypothetical protein [Microcystis aeruginosa G13-07]NCS11717.1 hypothetical protein [Microcystis aeruginosa G13-09]